MPQLITYQQISHEKLNDSEKIISTRTQKHQTYVNWRLEMGSKQKEKVHNTQTFDLLLESNCIESKAR